MIIGNANNKITCDDFVWKKAVFIEQRIDIFVNIIGMENVALKQNRYKLFQNIQVVNGAFMAFVFIEDNDCLNIGIIAIEVNRSKRIIKIGILRLNHDFHMAAFFICFRFNNRLDNTVNIGMSYDFFQRFIHFQSVLRDFGQNEFAGGVHIIKARNYFADVFTSKIIIFTHMRDVVSTDKLFCFTEVKHQRFGNGMNNAYISRKTFTGFHMLYQCTVDTAGFSDIVNCCVFAL